MGDAKKPVGGGVGRGVGNGSRTRTHGVLDGRRDGFAPREFRLADVGLAPTGDPYPGLSTGAV